MNEMVERVARAFHDSAESGVAWEELSVQSRAFVVGMTRALIEVMREPTQMMADTVAGLTRPQAKDLWRAMIDAALAE